MAANIILGVLIFGYAGFSLFKFIHKSKEGKCASCAIKNSCSSICHTAKGNDHIK
ncbi:FeoB-associated Cys-rich membrane protein [Bacillus sp. ISL-47]|uniref:FeoB-associated Cys-rich membrane protein n=1 Tax=Bacillus sp. ISL-47 TaxID=2819130 RepID=UPI001BED28C8|nr:FeoB-associated Cys-rich membrane protein [Bacillus sp. ISL-47]MBT2690762.1 FeoB-associated Cys-rich membrane protein [Bacillus sp. ISL-47]MBT2709706.1 FeoB-associated Cys-rich membrane protein [Pseudomonas sp. ISL-84]